MIQLHRTYLVTQNDDGILIIDQHALHERIMYEQFKERLTSGSKRSTNPIFAPWVPAGMMSAMEVTMAQTNLYACESQESYWRRVVAEWSAGGDTQAAFCRRRSISVTALRWWKGELARRDGRRGRGRRGAAIPSFVPVGVLPGPLAATALFEVVLGNGRVLRIPSNAEAESVARLASALEGQPC